MKKSEKITVSLSPETIRMVDSNLERLGFSTRSALVDVALREYVSRDLLKEFTGELSQFYQTIERSEIKQMEKHLAKLSYKIAVEIAQMHLLLTSMADITPEDIRKLRGKAVALVNCTKGYIPLDTANRHSMELTLEEDEDDGYDEKDEDDEW